MTEVITDPMAKMVEIVETVKTVETVEMAETMESATTAILHILVQALKAKDNYSSPFFANQMIFSSVISK
jgi:hypothetical protein